MPEPTLRALDAAELSAIGAQLPDAPGISLPLDVIELGIQTIVTERVRQATTFETEMLPRIRGMAVNAIARLGGQRFEPIHIEYPRDWWQALKARWYPAWALARWPVAMTVFDWTPSVVYPLIALPNEARWELPYRG